MNFLAIVFCISAFQIYSINGLFGPHGKIDPRGQIGLHGQAGPPGPGQPGQQISREQRARHFLNGLQGVGDQFKEDINQIVDTFKDDPFVMDYIIGVLDISGGLLDGGRRKIDLSAVKEHLKDLPNEYRVIDDANILETMLLRQLPTERINGLLTLFYALRNGATDEEIQNALGYLYGSETSVSHPNIPDIATQSCSSSRETSYYATVSSNARNLLKSVYDIKTKVLQDVDAIFEKFPCNYWISGPLARFAEDLKNTFHADTAKLDVCTIKRHWKRQPNNENINLVDWAGVLKSVLSTRLSEEVYNGLIGFMQTTHSSVPNKQIEDALTYFYGPQDNIQAAC